MMSGTYTIHAPLSSFLIFFFISSFKLCNCIGNNTIFCPKIEKQSLLSFKQSVKDPNNLLSSWSVEVNCCKWKGVICNSLTGHVHQLQLRSNWPIFPFESVLTGKINPSLLNLKYLRYLDLSGSDLLGEIPSFIGSFANLDLEWLSGLSQLEYLNMDGADLSKANNWAQVINSLPSLVELHFRSCSLDFIAPLDNVNISTSLKHLYLSGNSWSFITTPLWFFQFTNLLFLGLGGNSFTGPIPTITNSTKLQHIDLSDNHFNSTIPNWFYLCKDLKYVDLSSNLLSGTISNSIANLTSLNTFLASDNQLSGEIPKEIANLCKIQRLDLSDNNFQGEIFGNMSECFLEALENLYLQNNKLSGHLTYQFGEFKSLQHLDLSNNSLSGVIPTNIGKSSSLEELLLYDNKFTGTLPGTLGQLSNLQLLRIEDNKFIGSLPESLGQLFNLQQLYISQNMLEGVVTETHFANLTKLEELYASGNQLTLKVSPNWIPPFQLSTLQLASWNLGLGSHILSWLQKQRNIVNLDLSNTGIRGSLPRISDTMNRLDLSNNSFSGGVSHLLCDTTYQTYRLESLQLRGNQLSGEIPDCWMKWPSLRFLNLGSNNLSGRIPNSMGYLAGLLSLNLHGNRLSGKIPFVLHNCTLLVKMDLGDNDLDGGIPTWVGTGLFQLMFLILRSNKLRGEIPSEICHLRTLQIFDLSGNKFSGVIPRCLYNFTAMATKRSLHYYLYYDFYGPEGVFEDSASVVFKGSELQYESTLPLVTNINLSKNKLSGDIPEELTSLVELRSLNLSQNRLTGSIPDSIGDMKQLESLDLSINSLSGQIPNSFKLLSFLNYLNLSNNILTGRIPESTQLRGFDASCFTGNSLCGPPLPIKCNGDGDVVDGQKEEKEEEGAEESKVEWFYVVVSLGYAVGLSGVCSAMVLNKSWREAYFGLVEMMWDKLYVYVHIKWIKLSKP
ncbi:hypothetical protein ACS0TY_035890 [Phlomoides rotata]